MSFFSQLVSVVRYFFLYVVRLCSRSLFMHVVISLLRHVFLFIYMCIGSVLFYVF